VAPLRVPGQGHNLPVLVLAAPDKFRGTATAAQIAAAVAQAAVALGHDCDIAPIADGGEGLLECFGGANRETMVRGPSGAPVTAGWRLDGTTATVEMARASGLALTGPARDPVTATTTGTGELVAAALDAGAQLVIVGAGGSATTDGGLGAVDVLRRYAPLDGTRGYAVRVAADVTTAFVDAAEVFGPQKGARPDQVVLLTERLRELRRGYRDEFGVDVGDVPGTGAAGGLAGGLVALGAEIVSGFSVVAEQLRLAERVAAADLVITGEGRFDRTSLSGKSVGSLAAVCARIGTPLAVIAGDVENGAADSGITVISLVARFGREYALTDPTQCVIMVATELIRAAAAGAAN
jgi:glycerate kinase